MFIYRVQKAFFDHTNTHMYVCVYIHTYNHKLVHTWMHTFWACMPSPGGVYAQVLPTKDFRTASCCNDTSMTRAAEKRRADVCV